MNLIFYLIFFKILFEYMELKKTNYSEAFFTV